MPQLHVFRVDVYSPDGTERREYGQNAIARHERAAFTVPFALNDQIGEWKVCIKDVTSGETAEVFLELMH